MIATARAVLGVPRILIVSGYAIVIAIGAAFAAEALSLLIGLITNLAFFGHVSSELESPAGHHLGAWVIAVPVIGALIVGVMARYGSAAIRGHGIPEAMEQVLLNESRISPRVALLKPVSAAISIGSGGPFGAEGPIIATGGALGSLFGQVLRTTAAERKALLAAGAAAGMAATFGTPVAAVLLAIELLLFEYRPRSLIPVALAVAAATGVRIAFHGNAPVFPMPDFVPVTSGTLPLYILLGCIVGVGSVVITRGLYALEEQFEKLPVHWMWWPALGAIAVGVIGYFEPRTLGVGYDNIEGLVAGTLAGKALVSLALLKLVSWMIALASGTSGGTLAPLFTIGGGLGAILGALALAAWPECGLDVRIAALVGMAAMFAGASRALLASVVFAFETTRQPMGLLPLLTGCTAAYLASVLLMRHTIMTEKLARRGTAVRTEYAVDFLEQVFARDFASAPVVSLRATQTVAEVREWIARDGAGTSHQGFPLLDADERLIGVVTRRDLVDRSRAADDEVAKLVRRGPVVAYPDDTLREVADHMVREQIGRIPIVERERPHRLVGILTRSDLLAAHEQRLAADTVSVRGLSLPGFALLDARES